MLDVGAGNGWLSSRLSELGHDAVAVDLDDDSGDGLGAGAGRKPFPLVQADFDAMPFAPGRSTGADECVAPLLAGSRSHRGSSSTTAAARRHPDDDGLAGVREPGRWRAMVAQQLKR